MSQKYILVTEKMRNFFESIPPSRIGSVRISLCISEEKNLTARRGNLIYSPKIFWVPWIRWSACLHPGGRVLAGRPTDSRDLKCRGRVYPQRDISLSRWQGDEENFSLRVDPPLQFCSKLLYIYYKLWGIIWLNESKISRCQRDDENFFLRVYPLPGLNGISENIFLNPWIKKCPKAVGSMQGKNSGNMPSAVCASLMNKSLDPTPI